MGEKQKNRRLAKDMVNYARSNKYTGADMNTYGKYQDIIDDPDRSVEEITRAALNYNWLMTVGESIKKYIDEDEYTNDRGVKLWEQRGYGSAKEMAIRLVEEEGKSMLKYDDPYYEQPY